MHLNRRGAPELEKGKSYLASLQFSRICEFNADKFLSAAKNTEVLCYSSISKAPRKRLLYVGSISQELWLLSFARGCPVMIHLNYVSVGDPDST